MTIKEIKVTTQTGQFVIITTRDQEHRFGGKINHISSTEAQPYISANHDANGVCIGGRTMQQSLVDLFLKKAKEQGCVVEGE